MSKYSRTGGRGIVTSEAEGRASSTENKGKSWVWATGRSHAFERLISLEPKARLASGLLWWVPPFLLPCMGPMPNHASTHCGTWRVLPGGMSQIFRLLFLGNGWADCIEICYAVGNPLVTAYAVITGGVSLHVLTCRGTPHTAPLYLGNGLADCVQIWYVGWWSLSKCLPQVIGGVHLHVRTCALDRCQGDVCKPPRTMICDSFQRQVSM